MAFPRPTTDEQRRLLKLATKRAVKLVGGVEVAASLTRVGFQTVNDYGNASNERHGDTYVPLDVLMDLILDTAEQGEVSPLLQEICRQAGGSFVRAGAGAREGTPVELLNSAIGDLCTLRAQITQTTDDGDA